MSEFTLIYQIVSRGAEYDPVPAQPTRPTHRFGSITLSIHQPAR